MKLSLAVLVGLNGAVLALFGVSRKYGGLIRTGRSAEQEQGRRKSTVPQPDGKRAADDEGG
jgi:hypothetical protein